MAVLIFIYLIAVIIIIGFIGHITFKKTNLPSEFWLLTFGVLVSYLGIFNKTELVSAAEIIGALAIIGILSQGGMKLNLKELINQAPKGMQLMIVGVVSTVLISTLVLLVFGYSINFGLTLGFIIAGLSAAVAFPLVEKLKIGKHAKTIIEIESIADIFSVAIAILLIDQVAAEATEYSSIIISGVNGIIFGAVIGAIIGFLIYKLLQKIKKYEQSYAVLLAIFILTYWLTEQIDASGAIAVFMAGVFLGNSDKIVRLFQPSKKAEPIDENIGKTHDMISFFIRTFFFFYLGLLANIFDNNAMIIAIIIVIGIVAVRQIYVNKILDSKINQRDKSIISVIIPRGMAAAVLVAYAIGKNIEHSALLTNIVFTIILVSITISTIGTAYIQFKSQKKIKV